MSKVTSIIVDYNSIEFTERAIKSLLEHNDEFIDKVIVVDNFGVDDYKPLFNISRKVMVLKSHRNLGFGKAINLAMNYVNTPYILLQNPDTVIENRILAKLLDFINQKDNIGALTVVARTSEGKELLARRFTRPIDIVAGRRSPLLGIKLINKIGEEYRYRDKMGEQKPFTVDAFTGTFVLLKKDIYTKIGGFDNRFFLFMEDIDLSRKIRNNGYEIYALPECTIFHYTGATRGRIPFKSSFHKAKSVYLYFKKWNELSLLKNTFVQILLGLYTILTAFLDFIGFYRPEPSWRKKSEKRPL